MELVAKFLLTMVSTISIATSTPFESDAATLLALKDEMGASVSLQGWNSNNVSQFCSWEGITCDRKSVRVTGLDLYNKGIRGSIPLTVARLPRLAYLNLSSNFFTGFLPPGLGQCSDLKALSLHANNLTGTIPAQFSNYSALVNLDLSDNKFSGAIPSAFGELNRLEVLNLGNNLLRGPIPLALFNCTSLTYLALYGNFLNGSLPSEIGRLTNLQRVRIYYNNLTGSIPMPLLFNCTKLSYLSFSYNNFSGPIPAQIDHLWHLEQLWLNNNNFTGIIPKQIGNLSFLTRLQLGDNQFRGSIPTSFGKLRGLNYFLDIMNNFLSGGFPMVLTNLTSVQILKMRNNLFTGSIPREIGVMRNLTSLDLESNFFSGRLPRELGNCSLMVELRLQNNLFDGPIPSEFGRLISLSRLYLDRNQLRGPIPASLGNCAKLQLLSMTNNYLTGEIPVSVAGIQSLAVSFSLASNQLTGPIPTQIGSMNLVQAIDLSDNRLSGNIPEGLGECLELTQLNLSHNDLSGEIPNQMSNLHTLIKLDLSANRLFGTIPAALANMSDLQFINLSSNHLKGEIPSSGVFRNLTASSFLANDGLCGAVIGVQCHTIHVRRHKHSALKLLAIISAAGVASALFIFFIWTRGHHSRMNVMIPAILGNRIFKEPQLLKLSRDELQVATQGLNDLNILGVGAFSMVYKGTLADSTAVAIKKLELTPERREQVATSFIAELQALVRAKHRNLVRVLGYCAEPKSIILQLVPNGNLDKHLHDSKTPISWSTRFRIIINVAQAMTYLHHDCPEMIIHCDLKPSNILLDNNMEAHVGDFGLARILQRDDMSHGISTSGLKGSFGYMAPEYAFSGRITSKGDVYSFGIVLLEILTRTKPTSDKFINGMTLKQWVQDCLAADDPLRCIEDTLLEGSRAEEIEQMIGVEELAMDCCKENPRERPSMDEVVRRLLKMYKKAPIRPNIHVLTS